MELEIEKTSPVEGIEQKDEASLYPRFKDEESRIGDCSSNDNDNADSALKRHPTATSQANTVLARTISLVRTRESVNPGPPPDGGFQAWSQVALVHLVICNTWGYINSYGVFQTYYTETLGRTPSDISWVGSVQIFLLFFIGTFSGRATDAGFFKFTWTMGAIIEVVSIFLTSLCTKYWQLFLSQGILQGIGCGLMFCPTLALLPTYFSKRRALALGLAVSGSATGGMVFPAVVMRLLPRVGYAWTMRTLGFITLASLFPSFLFLKQRLPPRKTGPIVEWAAFKETPYSLFALGMFLVFWGLYVGFFYVGSFARNILGVSESDSINLLITMNGVGTFGRWIPNLMSDLWVGPLNMLIPLSLASAILAYAWAGVNNVAGLYVFAVIYGTFTAGVQGLFPVTLSSLTADLGKLGVRMGMVLSILSICVLTGNPIAGALIQAENGGYLYMQMFMGSSMIAGTLALAGARFAKSGLALVRV
jgi:predicted MFS family arabinose efflux permease